MLGTLYEKEMPDNRYRHFKVFNVMLHSGPSCSKLTMSLVNVSLKFQSIDTQIC